MKKKSVKALLCAAFMAMTLSMTACGGSDDAAKGTEAAAEAPAVAETPAEDDSAAEAPAEDDAAAEAPAEDDAAAEAPAEDDSAADVSSDEMTLEYYLQGDAESKKQLEEQAKSMSNENMDMEIEVNGNELVYVATLKAEIDNTDDLVKAVDESVGPVFSALAGAMDEMLGAEKGTVIFGIRYCTPDGNVFAESSFKAE